MAAIQETPRETVGGITPSSEQWKPEKEAREIALEAFHRQLSAFNAIPDSKLTKWELAERNTINELLASKRIDFSEEKDTFVDENGIRRGVPFQAFINSVASRALTDRQAEKDRNILERYSRSPISGIRGDGEKSSRVHSQLTELAKKGVRTRAEAAKRAQTGIRDFRPPPAANEKAPWGRIKKIKGASVKTPSPEWLLNAVVEKPAISGEVQRPRRASAWETRPSVGKFLRDDSNKETFTQPESTTPLPIPREPELIDYPDSFDEGTIVSGGEELEGPNPFDETQTSPPSPTPADRAQEEFSRETQRRWEEAERLRAIREEIEQKLEKDRRKRGNRERKREKKEWDRQFKETIKIQKLTGAHSHIWNPGGTPPPPYSGIPSPDYLQSPPELFMIIADRTQDLNKRARELARNRVRELIRGRKIVGEIMRQTEEERVDKLTTQVEEWLIRAGDIYAEIDWENKSAVSTDESRKLEQESAYARLYALGPKNVVLITSRLQKIIINEFLGGAITSERNPKEIQSALRAFIKAHKEDPDFKKVFGDSKYFATNLLAIAEQIRNLGITPAQAEQSLRIHFAKDVSWGNEAKLGRKRGLVKLMQSSKLAYASNPFALGFLASTVVRLSTLGFRTTAHVPIAGTAVAAPWAGIRRWQDLNVDYQLRNSQTTNGGRGKGEKHSLDRYLPHVYSSQGLFEELSLGNYDFAQADSRTAYIKTLAKIQAALDFALNSGADVITFQSRLTTEQEKAGLRKTVAEGMQTLAEFKLNGFNDREIFNKERENEIKRLKKIKRGKDWRFGWLKAKESTKAAAVGGAVGLAGGAAATLLWDVASPHVGEILTRVAMPIVGNVAKWANDISGGRKIPSGLVHGVKIVNSVKGAQGQVFYSPLDRNVPNKIFGPDVKVNTPPGTEWVRDGKAGDLVSSNNPDETIIDDARVGKDGQFRFDQQSSNYEVTQEKVRTSEKFNRWWKGHSIQVDERDFVRNGTVGIYERRELDLFVGKKGENVIITLPKGADGILITRGGDLRNAIWVSGEHGRVILSPDGPNAEVAKALINFDKLDNFEDGSLMTEVFTDRRGIFRICDNNKNGLIQAASRDHKIFATIQGSGPVPKEIAEEQLIVNINERAIEPSPTPEPIPTSRPTPEPTPSPTPVPTLEPTHSPIPTPEPTPIVTSEPTPSPTSEPTASPEPTPSPSPSPEPTRGPLFDLSWFKLPKIPDLMALDLTPAIVTPFYPRMMPGELREPTPHEADQGSIINTAPVTIFPSASTYTRGAPSTAPEPRTSGIFNPEAIARRGGTILPDQSTTPTRQANGIAPAVQVIPFSHPELVFEDEQKNKYKVERIEKERGEEFYIIRRIGGNGEFIRVPRADFETKYRHEQPPIPIPAPVQRPIQVVQRSGIRNFFTRIKNFILRRH